MSMGVVLAAMETYLTAQLQILAPGVFTSRVSVVPGGGPAPRDGEYSITIDEISVSSDDRENLSETYQVEVTINRRAKMFAHDDLKSAYLLATTGLDAMERKVIKIIHGNQNLRIEMDKRLGIATEQNPTEDTGGIFQMPLFYTGRGRTSIEDGTWGGAAPDAASWLVRRLNFKGATRVQDTAKIQ